MRAIRSEMLALVLLAMAAQVVAADRPNAPVARDVLVGHPWEISFGEKGAATPLPKIRYARIPAPMVPSAEQKQHVVQAIEHLEAAGLKDEAARLRQELSRLELEELERQRQRKAAELSDIEARIQLLRGQSWSDRVVTLRMCMVEIPQEWLAAMLSDLKPGYRLEPIEKATPGNRLTMITDEGEAIDRLIGVLSQQGVVNVLSRPVVKTLNGNSATILVGSEIPRVLPAGGKESQMAMDWFGQKIMALPTILDDKRIRLQVVTEHRERGADLESTKAARITTTVELKHGQTVLLTRPTGKGEFYVLTAFHAEVDDSAGGVSTAAKPRAESPYTAIPLSPRRLEPVPEPIPETAELPAPANVVR